MSENQPPPPPQPGPGWWLASDGRWYPPQQAPAPAPTPAPAYPTPYQTPVPPPSKSGKGCLVVLAVIGVIMLLIAALVAVALWKFASTVKDVTDGVTVGEVQCPTEEKVSDLVGQPVDLVLSGNVVVASGCNYSSGGDGVGVTIVSGAGLIGDDVLTELANEAQANGAELTSIDVGDDGQAYGSPMRSAAAAKADGHIVEVEVFAEGTEPIGDQRDTAVELLDMFIELND